jgi:putative transposase
MRRGTFSSVKDWVEKIDHYAKNSNRQAHPFVWTATTDSIFAKVERRCEPISSTAHSYLRALLSLRCILTG